MSAPSENCQMADSAAAAWFQPHNCRSCANNVAVGQRTRQKAEGRIQSGSLLFSDTTQFCHFHLPGPSTCDGQPKFCQCLGRQGGGVERLTRHRTRVATVATTVTSGGLLQRRWGWRCCRKSKRDLQTAERRTEADGGLSASARARIDAAQRGQGSSPSMMCLCLSPMRAQ